MGGTPVRQPATKIASGLGTTMYLTPCADCGKEVKVWKPKLGVVYKCAGCRAAERQSKLSAQLAPLLALRRLELAKQFLDQQYGSTDDYRRAIKTVSKYIDRPGWLQSSNEILVAVELVRCGLPVRHQVKMGKWRADFVLPDLKVVLEVDSDFHNNRREVDHIRDAAIIAALGPSWEIVRIKDKMVRQNLKKLVPAIKRVVADRRRLRAKRKGELPAAYTVAP